MTDTIAEPDVSCPLAPQLASALRRHRDDITRRWLERIAARVSLDANRIFPTDALLDHVPLLVDGIAAYLEDPAREITADVPVVAKAMELGELRHRQGFDAYEILKEYELFGGVLFSFLVDVTSELDVPCEQATLLVCAQRLFRAVAIIQQTTLTHFLDLANERANEREQRLRAFNRALSHEMKNRIGAVLGAADLLVTVQELDAAKREQFARMIVTNARDMQATLGNLLDLTRLESDSRQQRHVQLPEAVREVLRRLRDTAEARQVRLEQGELPPIEVNAAAMELMLTNYVSNAIKYSNPRARERWVRVDAEVRQPDDGTAPELVVMVRDNGLGVPPAAREKLFQRFYRAHEQTVTGIEGTGLGLHIVRETAESLGGRAWAEFPEEGSVFGVSVPCRREAEHLRATPAPGGETAGRAARVIRDGA